ncbi:Alpha-1,3/1,6-mannosyltransferase ALG2 [Neolecta irregularis DAH-3]|uniref:Alpha-1,3/1,6-mannosyltransferase ALG2 n=1 Tax=Neolecta irregularis (strain DAH-3) TaxID=1198029 RepID=A0A1U7LWR1_NEOID|nr:Alpha-1,3/1,6-mannosyltransferase ALG2 [Neolecta irregularis DAH-3]|eukprot:OLL27074.1 Alpha-1,3/1,6-mannosyltransferase ALG2 [Neolecta irregularis DAH-3]
MRVAFIHPDLGIGGAERLVVDAAVGLQNRGHLVTVYTSYCDRNHCFDEVKDGSLHVRVLGDSIFPTNISGRFALLCAILRQIHLVIAFLLDGTQYDVVFVDQLSTCIPLLKLKHKVKVLFYCHFPDKLLSKKEGLLKRLYRLPLDWVEEFTTGCADDIVVNSNFTASIFHASFTSIKRIPRVLYPGVDIPSKMTSYSGLLSAIQQEKSIFLSLNRFERKKNISLAISAYASLKCPSKFQKTMLVIAGGYDSRVAENVEYHKELDTFATSLGLITKTIESSSPEFDLSDINVLFLPSVSSSDKAALLERASLLLYTPSFEHFGIVPLEAMLACTPVLAINNGGPLETIEHNVTGWLQEESTKQWSLVMEKVLEMNATELEKMGQMGRESVMSRFSKGNMARQLEENLQDMKERPAKTDWVFYAGLGLFIALSVLLLIQVIA